MSTEMQTLWIKVWFLTAGSLEAPGVRRLLVLPGVKQQLTNLGVTHQNDYLTHRTAVG